MRSESDYWPFEMGHYGLLSCENLKLSNKGIGNAVAVLRGECRRLEVSNVDVRRCSLKRTRFI
jgi:hypothetical protein